MEITLLGPMVNCGVKDNIEVGGLQGLRLDWSLLTIIKVRNPV